tara:strand:- start:3532 stop:3669 length:138 start_codon:yes stop_codon:yes gene_type:complete
VEACGGFDRGKKNLLRIREFEVPLRFFEKRDDVYLRLRHERAASL